MTPENLAGEGELDGERKRIHSYVAVIEKDRSRILGQTEVFGQMISVLSKCDMGAAKPFNSLQTNIRILESIL